MYVSVWMIRMPVNWLHVGVILHCFLCPLSLHRKYFWLGASLPQPPCLRGVISLWLVTSSIKTLSVLALMYVWVSDLRGNSEMWTEMLLFFLLRIFKKSSSERLFAFTFSASLNLECVFEPLLPLVSSYAAFSPFSGFPLYQKAHPLYAYPTSLISYAPTLFHISCICSFVSISCHILFSFSGSSLDSLHGSFLHGSGRPRGIIFSQILLGYKPTMLSHPPFPCSPPSFHTAQGLAETRTPPIPEPPPPLKLLPAGRRGQGGRKDKKRELCLSVRDYRLPLSSDVLRRKLRSEEWEPWREAETLQQMVVLRCICLSGEACRQHEHRRGDPLMFGLHHLVSAGQHVVFAV